ncbi:MAG: hypothetical protein GY841_22945, partial [FCB group bacterium]|nr:hypothetical protein [FCB group bacterium]
LSCSPGAGSGGAELSVAIDAAGLPAGTYGGTVSIADANAVNSPGAIEVTLTVYGTGSSGLPFGSFDSPRDGLTVTGGIAVTGWAVDNIGIAGVRVYRDPAGGGGGGMVYIGGATLVEGARTDIEELYPGYPGNHKAGWGYMMLTNMLPNQGNGTFRLHAEATDMEGNIVSLGTKTI